MKGHHVTIATKTKKDAGTAPRAETHPEQLERLRTEVEALRDQLRHAQRLAAVGTMTAMVAHEFNNILTPIINYAHMAQSNPALTTKAITRAAEGSERATSICKAILDVAGRDDSEAKPVELGPLVEETLAAMARDPAKDGILVEANVPKGLTVKVRRVELQQVLLNLLMNAREAVLAGKRARRIEIHARRRQGRVRVRIADTGCGIAPEHLERIFQPFFSTRQDQDGDRCGRGLGLTICREIIDGMGGDISAESTVGEGTTFMIRLPV